ncbi:ras guanine nucleotide exchange factor domain-containing protein [Fimicolochytrium jonesii]|uniref:ras guanine nucleotide exchange factor domain-containing protein n=1 Tax=Fimicolochytrium jonesii TaxID=1396493 RepID=UPI0022FDE8F9|nr:ras guanine nucleotide exchange factor domain-containing protein [Fimicolochytrium jonesii]KAI8817620.1 ras guanine nucleotide exchange factor domain-containing protein [Fimicolochytrium jonesii]
MVRETPQLLVKSTLIAKQSEPNVKQATGTNDAPPRKSLMFSSQPQQADVLTEFLELQKGVGYFAKPSSTTLQYCHELEEVFVRIDLLGIHICENENKESVIKDVPIEEVINYSQNLGAKRFTFSHLESTGALRQLRFTSEKYFEIFEALGRAIAIVIKIKTKSIGIGKSETATPRGGSLSSLLEENEGPAHARVSRVRNSRTAKDSKGGSTRVSTTSNSSEQSTRMVQPFGHQSKSMGELISLKYDGGADEDIASSEVGQKATLAKYFIESRYDKAKKKLAGADSPKAAATMEDAGGSTLTRRWKNQARYDYHSLSKSRFKSDSSMNAEDSEGKGGVNSPQKPFTTSQSRPELSSEATSPPAPHARNASEPVLFDSEKKSRLTVIGLFGNKDSSKARPRAATEGAGESPSSTSPDSWQVVSPDLDGAAGLEKDTFGSLSGIKKIASKVSVKSKKHKNKISPLKESLSLGSAELLNDDTKKVTKIYDAEGQEILIKNTVGGKSQITAGTVDALVEALLDEPDQLYVDGFLLTFRHFLTPAQLLTKLTRDFRKFGAERTVDSKKRGAEEQLTIVALVKKWAGEHAYDFLDPLNMSALHQFLEGVQTSKYSSYSKQIRSLVQHALNDHEDSCKATDLPPDTNPTHELIPLLREFDILSQSTRKIAQQLTLVDSRMFRSIAPEEFTLFLWDNSPLKSTLTRRLQQYISRFNRIGYWVATVVCSFVDRQKRTEALELFIKVAHKCLEMCNFNTAMAILSGLNTTPVSRLKKTFAALPSRATTAYEDLEAKLSYKSNYKVYRELEHQAKAPMLPFFGLIIKDLTFLNDGNQKVLPNGLINFEKMREVCAMLSRLKEWQRASFPFIPDDEVIVRGPGDTVTLFTYCSHPPCMKEDQLLQLSKALEPPESSEAKGAPGTMRRRMSRTISEDVLVDFLNGKPLPTRKPNFPAELPLNLACTPMPRAGYLDTESDAPSPPFENVAIAASAPAFGALAKLASADELLSPRKSTAAMRESRRSYASTTSPLYARHSVDLLSPSTDAPGQEYDQFQGKASVGRRQSLLELGGSVRRKMSEGGLQAMLGWWKHEDDRAKSEDVLNPDRSQQKS